MLGLPERPLVAGLAMQQVMDPLRDDEELLVAFQNGPPRLDPGARDVTENRLQHLGHAAARRR